MAIEEQRNVAGVQTADQVREAIARVSGIVDYWHTSTHWMAKANELLCQSHLDGLKKALLPLIREEIVRRNAQLKGYKEIVPAGALTRNAGPVCLSD